MLFLKYLLIFLWGFIGVLWHLAVKASIAGHKSLPDIIGYYKGNIIRLLNSTLLWCGFFGLWWSASYWLPFIDHIVVAGLDKWLISKFGEGATIGSVMFLRSLKMGGIFVLVGFVIDSLLGNAIALKLARQAGLIDQQPAQKEDNGR